MSSTATAIPNRRQIVRACKTKGWSLQPVVLQAMEEHLARHRSSTLPDLLVLIGEQVTTAKTVTAQVWDQVQSKATGIDYYDNGMEDSHDDDDDDNDNEMDAVKTPSTRKPSTLVARHHHTSQQHNDWHVVSAFKMPRLVYQTMRKQFLVEEKSWSLFGTPEDKVAMLSQRYALVHQRILRNELFRPTELGHAQRKATALQHKLTPIESLLGKTAQNTSNTLLLLGILVQVEEGHYYLEDPSGQVLLSFQDAAPVDGFFVTEHCILLTEGTFQDGIFYVQRMGHPLLETRETSLQAIQQQVFHPSFALHSNKTTSAVVNNDASVVTLSDVHLDQPRVLQHLEGLLATYENYSPRRLPLFLFMGNFLSMPADFSGRSSSSGGSGGHMSMRQAMEELANLIAKFPNLARHAHFCLIPGPNDGVGHVLPFPPLPVQPAVQNKVAHVHWGSNPCRITWNGRELVAFRYDLLHVLQREQVLLQDAINYADDNDDDDMDEDAKHRRQPHCRLVKTVLDQGHLIPVQGVPVYWNYAHALQLYPLPDALVLGGDHVPVPYHEVYGGCDVIHPGSLHDSDGSYAVYAPDRDNDDDHSANCEFAATTVEFCQLGDDSSRLAESRD